MSEVQGAQGARGDSGQFRGSEGAAARAISPLYYGAWTKRAAGAVWWPRGLGEAQQFEFLRSWRGNMAQLEGLALYQ